jgi:hypothetical protein
MTPQQGIATMAELTRTLQWHSAVLSYALVVLTVVALVGGVWVVRDIRTLRRRARPHGGAPCS